jgi:hypothetical protein
MARRRCQIQLHLKSARFVQPRGSVEQGSTKRSGAANCPLEKTANRLWFCTPTWSSGSIVYRPSHREQIPRNELAPAAVLITAPEHLCFTPDRQELNLVNLQRHKKSLHNHLGLFDWLAEQDFRTALRRSARRPLRARPAVVGADYLGIGGVQDLGTPVTVRKRTQQPIAGPQDVPGSVATSSALSPRRRSRTIADGLQPDVGRTKSMTVAH